MIAFLKLIRFTNLLIIATTMIGIGIYFDTLLSSTSINEAVIWSVDFMLLVLSTILIAAAGNIINDYFDVKADRVNRPKSLIIGKKIKRRWAIILHWILNLLAFSIAIILSYRFQSFWYLFIHLMSINLLWFYSMSLKRTNTLGNITIALLTGLVPLLVGIFYQQYSAGIEVLDFYPFETSTSNFFIFTSLGLGGFAFLFNWAREIIKDIEDIEGDRILKAKTIAIQFGVKKAKIVSFIILTIPILLSCFVFLFKNDALKVNQTAFYPLIFAGIVLIFTFYKLLKAKTKKDFNLIQQFIKVIMVIGLSLPFYWTILINN